MPLHRLPVSITYGGPGSPGANVWAIRTDDLDPADDAPLNAASTAIKDFYTAIALHYHSSVRLTFTGELQPLAVPGPRKVITSWTVAGTDNVGQAPHLLAVVASARTSLASRSGSGRTFLGPLKSGAMQTDGTPMDNLLTDIRNALGTLAGKSLTDNQWAIGVWSPKLNLFHDVLGYTVKDKWGYLSSRRD